MHLRTLTIGFVTAAISVSASAQITYVDIDPLTNTTLADGSVWMPVSAVNGNDNRWAERPDPTANGLSIFEANACLLYTSPSPRDS